MTDFSKLAAGTRVWSLIHGWGKILGVSLADVAIYPVDVKFDKGGTESFTKDGKWLKSNLNPSIFLNEFKIPQEAFKAPMKVDTLLRVKVNGSNEWKYRYFCKMNGARVACYNDGATSKSTDSGTISFWDEWEVVND